MTRAERFFDKVEITDGCWLWTASVEHQGYGKFRDGRLVPAHRWAYEFLIGPIPQGLVLDPDHLEPVTERENILRGTSPSAQQARWTHCPQGHEFTPENTYVTPDGRHRRCRTCRRASRRNRKVAA